ncbi:beta-galactosidase [Kitasatospora terrestris]|uniref:Beta-galactosidase n=1 Tax=Kitasatospora terrestris TaxID=258051 RepID=A0ABP9DCS7_9ACTN
MGNPLAALTERLGGIAYGGDYNPEQWPEHVWHEDMRLMREAGVNLVTLGVFSWSRIQPGPDTWDFSILDTVMDLLHEHGIAVDLATPTAAPPPWFTHHNPDALPVTADGTRLAHGSRQAFCPSSPAYARAADAVVTRLATRYATHPALVAWHVHNEWGNHNALCYCDISAAHFRRWLQERHTTLDNLNAAWGTDFWSQRYGGWEEIQPPRATTAFRNPGQDLDYRRFCSDALLIRHEAESTLLHRHAPGIPVTTNLMGTLERKIDGHAFSRRCDFIAVDHYLTAADPHSHIDLSLNADLARGMAEGQPWLLMEHSTSAVNWQPVNLAKAPGQMRRNSLAHLARGADGIMFFQWRQSRAGAEKWHSAMLPHGGTGSRIWHEVTSLGTDLARLREVSGTQVSTEVGLLFDWPTWWALELEARPSEHLRYLDLIHDWYGTLWNLGITCDLISPDADLGRYRAVFAPNLYLATAATVDRLTAHVHRGGHLAVGPFSGVVDEHDRLWDGPHPAALAELLGLTVDEYLPLPERAGAQLDSGTHARLWAERVRCDTSSPWMRFADTPYGGPARGGPAITVRNDTGGTVWYAGARLPEPTLVEFLDAVCHTAGIRPTAEVPPGVEAVRRTGEGRSLLFLINHTRRAVTVPVDGTALLDTPVLDGYLTLDPGAVAVIREHSAKGDGR